MAHFLKYFVVPEVRRRVDARAIASQLLPFYVRQFRFLQIPGKTHLELNDEARGNCEREAQDKPTANQCRRTVDRRRHRPRRNLSRASDSRRKTCGVLPLSVLVPQFHYALRFHSQCATRPNWQRARDADAVSLRGFCRVRQPSKGGAADRTLQATGGCQLAARACVLPERSVARSQPS